MGVMRRARNPVKCRVGDLVRPHFRTTLNGVNIMPTDTGLVINIFVEEHPGGTVGKPEMLCFFHGRTAWWDDDELEVVTDEGG